MFRGTCSSIQTLKGYMVRESQGTPVLVGSFTVCRLYLIVLYFILHAFKKADNATLVGEIFSLLYNILVSDSLLGKDSFL